MHDTDAIETVMRYHERTKHRFDRYAPGPGELDWANQPSLFRHCADAPLIRLPLLGADAQRRSPRYDDLYRRGSIGQVLYLEAVAAGVQATGIGCFFDDPVHQLFGIEDFAFQSLYHFTVGGAVDDPRLTTLAPYGARADASERGIDLP